MKFLQDIGKAFETGQRQPEDDHIDAQVLAGRTQNRRQFLKTLSKGGITALTLSSGGISLFQLLEQQALAGDCSKEKGWDCMPEDLDGILPLALEELYHRRLDVVIDITGIAAEKGRIVGIQKKILKQGEKAEKEVSQVNACMLQNVREPAVRKDGIAYASTSCNYGGDGSRYMLMKHRSGMVRFVYRLHKLYRDHGDFATQDFLYEEHRKVVLGLVKKMKTEIKQELQAKGILGEEGKIDQVALLADLQQKGLIQNGKVSQPMVISGLRRLGMLAEESDVVIAKGY